MAPENVERGRKFNFVSSSHFLVSVSFSIPHPLALFFPSDIGFGALLIFRPKPGAFVSCYFRFGFVKKGISFSSRARELRSVRGSLISGHLAHRGNPPPRTLFDSTGAEAGAFFVEKIPAMLVPTAAAPLFARSFGVSCRPASVIFELRDAIRPSGQAACR